MEWACTLMLCFGAVMVMTLPLGVQGECVLKNPPVCESSSPVGVVKSVVFNTTCDPKKKIPVFNKGESYEMKINFRPSQDSKFATVQAKVSFGPLLIPVRNLGNPDACVNHGLTCPLKADQDYTFVSVFKLRQLLPIRSKMEVKLRLYLLNQDPDKPIKDDTKNQIFCIVLSEFIQPGPSEDITLYTGEQEDQNLPAFRIVP